MRSFSHSFTVKEEDIDEQGHVNNVTYLKWVQDVAIAHWTTVAGEEIREEYSWVVLRHEIDYKKGAFAGDALSAHTWVGDRTKITWDRHTRISRGEEVLAEAKTVWCLVRRDLMRPARISEEIERLLSKQEEAGGSPAKSNKI
jgi:acyl-CoA thioester hydrolase